MFAADDGEDDYYSIVGAFNDWEDRKVIYIYIYIYIHTHTYIYTHNCFAMMAGDLLVRKPLTFRMFKGFLTNTAQNNVTMCSKSISQRFSHQ